MITTTTPVLDQAHGNGWAAYQGDCVDVIRGIPDSSVDFSIFSPPFASLYTYSPSERDMGNCRTPGEFFEHFGFLTRELLRVSKPGRLMAFHCMDLPSSKARDGYIGVEDFRGDLTRACREAGWIRHSEVCIWKDPVTQMQRTKALGLLHKTIRKDSSMSRVGLPDYLVVMRKPGVNPDPIPHTVEEFPVERWQRYASPVWVTVDETRRGHIAMIDELLASGFDVDDLGSVERALARLQVLRKGIDDFAVCSEDIRPGDTLQKTSAREEKDERHICPLQLEVIRRALDLWTNPGDVVLTPFGGIGSEGYEAVRAGRKAVLIELKASYFKQQIANMANAEPEAKGRNLDLFASLGAS